MGCYLFSSDLGVDRAFVMRFSLLCAMARCHGVVRNANAPRGQGVILHTSSYGTSWFLLNRSDDVLGVGLEWENLFER